MDKEATITQDGGALEPGALLSLDDLIMRIGTLTVEGMHKDRALEKLGKELRTAQEARQSSAQELGQVRQDVSQELEKAKKYKESHDKLAEKHTALQDTLSKANDEVSRLRIELKDKESKVGRLSEELAKAPKPRNLPPDLHKLKKAELIALLEE